MILYKGTHNLCESSSARQFCFAKRVHGDPKQASLPLETRGTLSFYLMQVVPVADPLDWDLTSQSCKTGLFSKNQ